MADLAKLVVRLEAESSKLRADLDKSQRKLEAFSKKAKRQVAGIKNSFVGLATALAGAGVVRAIVRNSIAQENALRQLETRIRSTSGAAGKSSTDLQKFAAGLQDVTTYGDEAIIELQALLLTFTQIRGDKFDQATEAVLNMSVAMGTDLKSSALQVGKALNDPILGVTALTRSGIQFSEQQKEVIKALVKSGETAQAQGIILTELETQFGGAARAARDTFGGALQSVSNAFGDLLEADSMSGATVELKRLESLLKSESVKQGFDKITTAVFKLLGGLSKGIDKFTQFGTAIGEFFAKAVNGLSPVDRLKEKIADYSKEQERLGEILKDSSGFAYQRDRFVELTRLILDAREELKLYEGDATRAQAKPDLAPVIRKNTQALEEYKTKVEEVRDVWDRAMDLIDKSFEADENAIARQIAGLDAIQEKAEDIRKDQEKVKKEADEMGWAFESAFENAILEGEKFSDVLRGLVKDMAKIMLRQSITKPAGQFLGSLIGGMFADGGNPPVGKASIVGERGPELIVPRSPMTVIPNHALGRGGSPDIYITVNAPNAEAGVDQKIRAGVYEAVRMSYDAVYNDVNRAGPIYKAIRA